MPEKSTCIVLSSVEQRVFLMISRELRSWRRVPDLDSNMDVASLDFLGRTEGTFEVKNCHIRTRKHNLLLVGTMKNSSLVRPSDSLSLSISQSRRDGPEVTG